MTDTIVKDFAKEELTSMLMHDSGDITLIKDELYDTSRWSEMHQVVFQENSTGDYYSVCYNCGATELQDEAPFEYDDDMIECIKVKKVKITVDSFVAVTYNETAENE